MRAIEEGGNVRFHEKIPGALLLVPMFITAIIYTFWPTLFQIGGATQAVFSA
ncbi:2-keto-3-deoxygluconate permease [Trichococcus palustris]|uniref:2-keto-3-deoxygluconate permease n=1 Tax=Trichococcus palustris TaxID=140314 RepID=UPI000B35847E